MDLCAAPGSWSQVLSRRLKYVLIYLQIQIENFLYLNNKYIFFSWTVRIIKKLWKQEMQYLQK